MNVPRTLSALAATTLVLSGLAGEAAAQTGTCPLGKVPQMSDPANAFWAIEGPLVSVDTLARTIRVFDSVIQVPETLLIHTGADKYVTLNEFVNPAYEAVRTVVGGTIMAQGNSTGSTSDPDGDGCMNMVAEQIYFEFGEHLMVGLLAPSSVDVNNNRLYLHGVPMTMNTDPRIPAEILDINGNPVLKSMQDLLGFEGTLLGPEGYFEGDTLRLVVLETEAYIPNPNADDPFITVARYETKDRYIRVRGGTADPIGATYVDVFAPGKVVLNSTGTGKICQGTRVGRATVESDPVEGSVFDFLTRKGGIASNPGTVCVQSELGGTAYRVFDLK